MSEEKKLTDEKTLEFAEDINVPNKRELSDEEIVKSLECCTELGRCTQCPYFIKGIDCVNEQSHEKDILDFIHRLQEKNAKQKAEIERLTEAGNEAVRSFTRMETLYKVKCKELEISEEKARQAVKDTAKEIFSRLAKRKHQGVDVGGFFVEYTLRLEDLNWFEARYGVEVVCRAEGKSGEPGKEGKKITFPKFKDVEVE